MTWQIVLIKICTLVLAALYKKYFYSLPKFAKKALLKSFYPVLYGWQNVVIRRTWTSEININLNIGGVVS